MYSAFGIDHGEGDIEKAFGLGAAAGGLRRMTTSLGQGIGNVARAGATKSGQMAGKNINKPGMRSLGRGQVKAGQGLRKISRFAQANPLKTGGLAIGGAAGGAAGVGGVAALGNGERKRF